MHRLAGSLINDLKATSYQLQTATVVGLSGELGAGKTTFVKGIARAFGVREMVTSPTFVIMKVYTLVRQPWRRLLHIDAYRIESPEELRILGWDDIVTDRTNLIFVEWAEKVRSLLPCGYRAISFDVMGEDERRVLF